MTARRVVAEESLLIHTALASRLARNGQVEQSQKGMLSKLETSAATEPDQKDTKPNAKPQTQTVGVSKRLVHPMVAPVTVRMALARCHICSAASCKPCTLVQQCQPELTMKSFIIRYAEKELKISVYSQQQPQNNQNML